MRQNHPTKSGRQKEMGSFQMLFKDKAEHEIPETGCVRGGEAGAKEVCQDSTVTLHRVKGERLGIGPSQPCKQKERDV